MDAKSGNRVPIIDITDIRIGNSEQVKAVAREIDHACCEIGFLVVTGHGVPEEVSKTMWTVAEEYFDLPVAEKVKIPMTGNYPYGYSGFEEETLSRSRSEEAPPDLKESFSVGPYRPPSTVPETQWPAEPREFKGACLAYYQAMEKLAAAMMRSFAFGLGLAENWFEDKIDHHSSALRALNYPALIKKPKERQLRASAHTDYGSLTILKSGGPGLQVKNRDGHWVDVPYVDDAYIINIGDLMAYWTNDRWVSTLHRVLAPQLEIRERRQSIAFFHNVNDDAVIKCIDTCTSETNPRKYLTTTAGAHRAAKHAAAAGKP